MLLHMYVVHNRHMYVVHTVTGIIYLNSKFVHAMAQGKFRVDETVNPCSPQFAAVVVVDVDVIDGSGGVIVVNAACCYYVAVDDAVVAV